MRIRDFRPRADADAVTACLVELQDFERTLDARLPSGAEIAGAYLPDLLQRCREFDGKILVADVDGEVAGYASIMRRMRSDAPEDGDTEFGFVGDLVVREGFRNRGIGRRLLEAAEAHAKAGGARWLRIGVLAKNRAAADLYAAAGFEPYGIQLEKRLPSDD